MVGLRYLAQLQVCFLLTNYLLIILYEHRSEQTSPPFCSHQLNYFAAIPGPFPLTGQLVNASYNLSMQMICLPGGAPSGCGIQELLLFKKYQPPCLHNQDTCTALPGDCCLFSISRIFNFGAERCGKYRKTEACIILPAGHNISHNASIQVGRFLYGDPRGRQKALSLGLGPDRKPRPSFAHPAKTPSKPLTAVNICLVVGFLVAIVWISYFHPDLRDLRFFLAALMREIFATRHYDGKYYDSLYRLILRFRALRSNPPYK